MPSYGPGSHSYTTDGDALIELGGGEGGVGAYDGAYESSIGDGGRGGQISIQITGSSTVTMEVANAGGTVTGGSSPYYNGGDGAVQSNDYGSAEAGGGGGSTAVYVDGTLMAVAEGGGGGAVGDENHGYTACGGGGARGGQGGEDLSQYDSPNGSDGSGSGDGGDGGDVLEYDDYAGLYPGDDGEDGGELSYNGANVQSTGWNYGDGFVTITEAPSAPGSISQTINGDDDIDVTWDSSDNANSYDLQVSEDGGDWTQIATPSNESYSYAAATSTNTHRFRVRAASSAGTSDWTYSDEIATDPTSLSATTQGVDEISTSWDSVPAGNGYAVLRSTSSGSTPEDYQEIATTNETSYTDVGLDPATEYFYRVRAIYDGTDSYPSNEASSTTDLPPPTLDSVTANVEGELDIAWTIDSAVADGTVSVLRSQDGSIGSVVETIDDLSVDTYTDTGLDDGTLYYYTIRLESGSESEDSGQLSETTILPPPTELGATDVGESAIDISWTATHNAGETRVEFKPTDEPTWSVSETIDRTTEAATISGLRNGERYDIRVIAVTDHEEKVDQ